MSSSPKASGSYQHNPPLFFRALRFSTLVILMTAILILLPYYAIRADLYYIHAYIYVLVHAVCIYSITWYLYFNDQELLLRRFNRPSDEPLPTQVRFQYFTYIMITLLISGSAVDYSLRSTSPIPFYVSILAHMCICIAYYMIYLVFRSNTFAGAQIRIHKNQRVVSTGLYGIVRHPMYTACVLLFISVPLSLGSVHLLLVSIILSCGLIYRLLDEERYLGANLQGYNEYCKKVKSRLVPYIY
jgi:protein-S-isoprenylcysteine O-methyltransferase Ste14